MTAILQILAIADALLVLADRLAKQANAGTADPTPEEMATAKAEHERLMERLRVALEEVKAK